MVSNSVSYMLPRPTKSLTTDARNVSTGDPLTCAKVWEIPIKGAASSSLRFFRSLRYFYKVGKTQWHPVVGSAPVPLVVLFTAYIGASGVRLWDECIQNRLGVGGMTQQLRGLDAPGEDLSSGPSMHLTLPSRDPIPFLASEGIVYMWHTYMYMKIKTNH